MKNLLLIFLLYSSILFSNDTVFVSQSGANIPPFNTWATASKTIQHAVNNAVDGNVILINEGTYIEKIYADKKLSFQGVDRENCIIDITEISHVDSFDFCFQVYAECSFRYLTIINNFQSAKHDYGIYAVDNKLIVEHCNFERGECIATLDGNLFVNDIKTRNAFIGVSISATGVDTAQIIIQNSQIYSERDCIRSYGGNFIIRNNIFGGDSLAGFAVRHMISYESMIFENNIVTGINRVCIKDNHYLYKSIIRNNLFYNCWDENDFEYVLEVVYSPDKIFENNIILNCGGGIVQYNPDTMYTNHNLFWNVKRYASGNVKLGEREIFAEPMFVTIHENPIESDFRLQKYSPAINAGNPEILDKDGSISDIGPMGGLHGESYEYEDLPPSSPRITAFEFDSLSHDLRIEWERTESAPDFSHYEVHRGKQRDFNVHTNTVFSKENDTLFTTTIPDVSDSTIYYKVVGVDNQGNKSESSKVLKVVLINKIVKVETIQKLKYELKQNYPNPFNPETSINYQLKNESHVLLEILDIKGERIEMLVDENQGVGEHSVIFDGSNLASGVYFYRLEVKDEKGKIIYSQGNKMVLLK